MLLGMSGADALWCESVARYLLIRMDAEHATRVTVDDVCAAFDLRMSPKAPKGCDGTFVGNTMRVASKGRAENRARGGQHEVGHLGTQLWDRDLDVHPEDAMVWVGLCVEIPRRAALRAVQDCGFDPRALSARFPGLYPSDVLARCAIATGGLAVLVRARSEAQWVANDVGPDDELALELRIRSLVASARQRDGFVEAGEWAATPIEEPGRTGVLVVRR